MQQPSIVEYVAPQAREQGKQQGAQEATRKHILEALSLRLKIDTEHSFKSVLEKIEDLEILENLHRAAIVVENLDDFRQILDEYSE